MKKTRSTRGGQVGPASQGAASASPSADSPAPPQSDSQRELSGMIASSQQIKQLQTLQGIMEGSPRLQRDQHLRDLVQPRMVADAAPIQRAAISKAEFPLSMYNTFTFRYKGWRDAYLHQRKIVYGSFSLSGIMAEIAKVNPTFMAKAFQTELAALNLAYATALVYTDTEDESHLALADLQTFVGLLDKFLDKWEDDYGTEEVAEKDRLAEILVKVTTPEDLGIATWEATVPKYAEALKKRISGDPRLIQTLRGKDSMKMHLRDDREEENMDAIDRAVAKIRNTGNLTERKKANPNIEWSTWRGLDCVFAAIIYVMNDNEAKYENVLGSSPSSLDDEDAERDDAKGIADKLGVNYGVVEDPVLFNIMKRLGWAYTGGESWNTWVGGRKFNGSKTYVISYSTTTSADSNHTVVFSNGVIYDRQRQRLGGSETQKPSIAVRDLPMEIWEVDTEAASAVLT